MAAPQQPGQEDQSTAILWIVAAVFVAGAVIWYLYKSYIITAYLDLKLYEINLLSFFTSNLAGTKATIQSYLADPKSVSFQQVIDAGRAVGDYLRLPLVVILFFLAFFVYKSNLVRTYKRTYSMNELAKLEKTNWPQIYPVVNLDLVHTDIDTGPWAMALTPMQYCKKNKLLEEHKVQRKEGMTREEWNRVEVTLKRGEANKLFALQLGPMWGGVDRLPLHIKALFAVFAARIEADTKTAQDMLRQFNFSCTTKLDFQGVNELCKKHEKSKRVQQVTRSHAYVFTVMAAMLEAAREDGVQASADFLWLKPMDRRLWYTLNAVGRQTPFVEVAGIFAHWVAEKTSGRKLLVPMVDEATRALEVALKDVIYHPDEKEER